MAIGSRAPSATPGLRSLEALAPIRFTRRHWRAAVITTYAILLATVELHHEPWFDEAQAWLLARDASPWELVAHRLHYEGTPGLWQLILMPFAKAGLPYRTVSVLGALFALAGVVVFVRRAPLPPLVAASVPFTYFILFQYGVVARSYSVLLLLLSLVAAGWRGRWSHPVRHMLLLGLLSQVSLHGLIVAASVVVADLPELSRRWQAMAVRRRRAQIGALTGFLVLTVATVVELWPTADNSGGGSWHLGISDIATASATFTHSAPVPLLIVPALLVLGWWFRVRGVLPLVVLAVGGLGLLFVLRYASPWHGGVVFVVILFALWISWPQSPAEPGGGWRHHRLRSAALVATMLIIATQLVWTAAAVRFDLASSYSGTAGAAEYLASHLAGRRVDAVGKWSVGLLPYFRSNVFNNYHHAGGPSYWPWSYATNPLQGGWSAVLADHPDAIVVTAKSRSPATLPCIPGYHQAAVFPGAIYFAMGPYESETVAIYELQGPPPAPDAQVTSGCGAA